VQTLRSTNEAMRGPCLKIDGKTRENLQNPMIMLGLHHFHHLQFLGIANFRPHAYGGCINTVKMIGLMQCSKHSNRFDLLLGGRTLVVP
jgi:hypothetical protein